jgi:hypothetical protein
MRILSQDIGLPSIISGYADDTTSLLSIIHKGG